MFFLSFLGQPLCLQEIPGFTTVTLPSKSSPETQSMVLLCNMGISWLLSTLSVALAHGCLATVLTFTPEVAVRPTSIPVQLQTPTQASRSSKGCKTPASSQQENTRRERCVVEGFSLSIALLLFHKSKLKYTTVWISPVAF